MSDVKSVVITGASSGIGRASALRLDRDGFRVFAGVRTRADAETLNAVASPRLTAVQLDVTEPESIAVIERVMRAHGVTPPKPVPREVRTWTP